MNTSITERAPAKLTLSLRITGTRPDGYHLIDADMVTLDLADELTFAAGDGLEVVAASGGLPVPAGDDNLVRRALAAVGARRRCAYVRPSPPGPVWVEDRRTPPPCCAGPAAPICPWPPRSAPTWPSAWWAVEPASVVSERW
jgi:hypothetical protein